MNIHSFENTTITGGFWKERMDMNRLSTAPMLLEDYRTSGRMASLKCAWREGMPDKPHIFWDSDVAKWIEGVAYIIRKEPDGETTGALRAAAEEAISDLLAHQCPDGYMNSYFTGVEPARRFQDRSCHELYCAGHLTEAAIAWKHATGDDTFLRAMEKYIALIDRVFRVEKSTAFSTPGHEELELALMLLYSETNDKKYLTLAKWFIDARGSDPHDFTSETNDEKLYSQSLLPVRRQFTAEGHAVRAAYLYTAMADAAAETGDEELKQASLALFDNITRRRMYITGGTGSSHRGESFTTDYDLPSETAYTETCSSIALALFARRLQKLDRNNRYADIVERVFYNGYQAGTSLDGKRFFYSDPIEILSSRRHGRFSFNPVDWLPVTERVTSFGCSCCPPNIVRFTAAFGDYVWSYDDETLFLDQFADNVFSLSDGTRVTVRTDYPVHGRVQIESENLSRRLAVRVPGWCRAFTLDVPYSMENGYAVISPENARSVTFDMDMTPFLVRANRLVADAAHRAAVMRGPIVYALEGVDNPSPLHALSIDPDTTFTEEAPLAYFLPTLAAKGALLNGSDELYSRYDAEYTPVTIRLIPYFMHANRGESDMRIWIPVHR